jgi:hypothetical protein
MKRIVKIGEIFMFYHLKAWQSWQIVFFHSYECKIIQTTNPFDKILNLKLLKVNTYCIKRNEFLLRTIKRINII